MTYGSFTYGTGTTSGGRERAAEVAELAAQEGSGWLIVLYLVGVWVVIWVLLGFVGEAQKSAERAMRK